MKKNRLKETGKYFSRSQLLLLTELTPTQFKGIYESGMMIKDKISPNYQLYEVVYCRLIFLLRKEFSLNTIRDSILDLCHFYKDDFFASDFARICLETGNPEKLTFCQIDSPEFKDYLDGVQMCIDRKTLYSSEGKDKHDHVVWINLWQILLDMSNRAIDLKFDNVDKKFVKFLNQQRSNLVTSKAG